VPGRLNNVSYDAKIGGKPVGTFTYFALKARKTLNPQATYADWHKAISPVYLLSVSYPQSPQIVAGAAGRQQKIFARRDGLAARLAESGAVSGHDARGAQAEHHPHKALRARDHGAVSSPRSAAAPRCLLIPSWPAT
jgi:hypothetical protein